MENDPLKNEIYIIIEIYDNKINSNKEIIEEANLNKEIKLLGKDQYNGDNIQNTPDNKEIQINNSINLDSNLLSTENINSSNTSIFINNQIIPFRFTNVFTQKGRYKIKFVFNNKFINCNFLFDDCEYINEIDLSHFDFTHIESIMYIFNQCTRLKKVKFAKNINTPKLKNIIGAFADCKNLESIENLDKADFSNVEKSFDLFLSCEKLKKITISPFDLPKIDILDGLCQYCRNLKFFRVKNQFDKNKEKLVNMFKKNNLKDLFVGVKTKGIFLVPENSKYNKIKSIIPNRWRIIETNG